VDGLQETHDRIRTKGKKGSFANLCRTIEHLAPWRERYSNLRLRLNSVVTPDNIGEMRATIDYFYTHHDVDEHALEIVRDLSWLDAHHESPERKGIAHEFHELVEYSYGLYFLNGGRRRNGADRRRAQFRDLPERLSNLATYAYSLATSEIKVERMMGKLWPFACTAGRKILVVSGSGSLRACEHRGEVVDLREFDFDFGRAMATGRMENEIEQIRKDRCDCLHGCFVGNSLQHKPTAIVQRALPKALHPLRHRAPRPASAVPAPEE
jgi:sulfatase maturation enzyme AslB (radical SAM superfamily)